MTRTNTPVNARAAAKASWTFRASLAILVAKVAAFTTRLIGAGAGTSLPGCLALRIEPRLVSIIVSRNRLFTILVTGSNGKTTTSRMIAGVLRQAGKRIVWNKSGANLSSGVATTLIRASRLSGLIDADFAVLETDEAHMRMVLPAAKPRVVVVTNCFRDQLDRYGEVDTTRRMISEALDCLSPESTLVLNADDPLVASLGQGRPCRTQFFGVDEDLSWGDAKEGGPSDARNCLRCGASFRYSSRTYGHLGKYGCSHCGYARPTPAFSARKVGRRPAGLSFTLHFPGRSGRSEVAITSGLPGLFNAYNCLAAAACCLSMGVSVASVRKGIARMTSAFGRMETVRVEDRDVLIALVKNPVGLSEVARTLCIDGANRTFILCLNDRFADGRDISWIWDADLEQLAGGPGRVNRVIVSGLRAWDMALRLKYAGVEKHKIVVEPDLRRALDCGLSMAPAREALYILPTYTALLEMREHVRRRCHGPKYWTV